MATTYRRIRLSGYVDWASDTDKVPPVTHAEILQSLWDMSLCIGDIEDLTLTIVPLTFEEIEEEARKIAEKIRHAHEVGERLRKESEWTTTPENMRKAEKRTQEIKDVILIKSEGDGGVS